MIRVCHRPDANLPALKSTKLIGGNQGNLLFQFSTSRALAAESTALSYINYAQFKREPAAEAERINSECDHLVLPLSSSLRFLMGDELNQWADLIERLTIPVTVVGIGAQLNLEEVENKTYRPGRVTGVTAKPSEVEEHEAACRRFLSAVLDRTASIGVRGEISADYLRHLGFGNDQIDVIGCPSMFMHGPGFRLSPATNELGPDSELSLSFDHRIPTTAGLLQRTVDEYPKSLVYAQEHLTARMVITGEETRANWRGDERFPVHTSNPLYSQHRLVYYPTAWAWMDSLKTADFTFGPRLHGTVAALLAGTPIHLLAHDSRTVEVAQYHQVPHTLVRDLGEDASARQLHEAFDPSAFNSNYDELFGRFEAFLKRNGLTSAYQDAGGGLAKFDDSLTKARRAKPRFSDQESNQPQPKARSLRERAGALLARWRN